MHPPVHPVTPAVELQLKVQRIREPPARLEVGAHEPMRALQHALGLRITGVEDTPADLELPTEAGDRGGRAAAAGVDRTLAVPHQLLRQRADLQPSAPRRPAD